MGAGKSRHHSFATPVVLTAMTKSIGRIMVNHDSGFGSSLEQRTPFPYQRANAPCHKSGLGGEPASCISAQAPAYKKMFLFVKL